MMMKVMAGSVTVDAPNEPSLRLSPLSGCRRNAENFVGPIGAIYCHHQGRELDVNDQCQSTGSRGDSEDDLKARIVAFMRGASTEITPPEESRLGELASVLPAGTPVYVAHTPHAGFAQVVHAALAVQRAGFLATPHIAVRRVPAAQMLREALAELRAGRRRGLFC